MVQTKSEIQKLKKKIEKLEKERQILKHARKFDPFTGLYNKNELMEVLKKIIKSESLRNKRKGITKNYHTLAMIDLDHFKEINDYYGHAIGDKLLLQFADFLRNHLRFSDLVFRYGGDEFAIVFLNLKARQAYQICERLRIALSNQIFYCRPHHLKITASFGVYAFKNYALTSQIIKRADKALYRAKKIHNKTIIYR